MRSSPRHPGPRDVARERSASREPHPGPRGRPGTARSAVALGSALLTVVACGVHPRPLGGQEPAPDARTAILRPERILDGTGGIVTGREVVVREGRIVAIAETGRGGDGIVYDLSGATLLPGLIDTHVHIGWHFDRATGRIHSGESDESPEERILYAAENAWATLRAGVTTVQSVGSPEDLPLRDAIASGTLPGPRLLTSIRPITAGTGGPDSIRASVRRLAADGADLVKIFASESIRDGGGPTLSQARLDAACAEARAHGLRTLVHAHGPESARRTALAGCTQLEHGALLDRPTLEMLAERGVYYDPHTHLVFQNYFDHEERFLGVGNYTEEGFRQMRDAVPTALRAFREAIRVPGLEVVFGTDAVAGAHGRNHRELVYRVREGGQDPMGAIVSATGLAARSLGLEDRIGTVEVDKRADLIAVEGDPVEEIEALGRVVFVSKGGTVYRYEPVGGAGSVPER